MPQNEKETNRGDARLHDQSSSARHFAGKALRELQSIAHDVPCSDVCKDETEWCVLQSKPLVSWAKKRELLVGADEFRRLTDGRDQLPSGMEHRVLALSEFGRVLKVTMPPHFGHRWDLIHYVNNIIWSNELFDDDIRIVAVLDSAEGAAVATTQPYIDGRPPTESEIEQWFQIQGYVSNGPNRWKHVELDIEIEDAHTGNLLVMDDGTVAPIDLQVIKPGNSISQAISSS